MPEEEEKEELEWSIMWTGSSLKDYELVGIKKFQKVNFIPRIT